MRVRGGLVPQFLYRCSCQCADRWWGAPGCGFPGATAPESAGGEKRRTPLQMVAKRDEPGASDDPDHSRRRPGPVAALSPNRKIHNDPISCADPRLFVYRFDGERPSAQEIGLFRFFPVGPSFSSPFPWATGWGLTTRPAEAALPRGAPCGYPIPALLYCAIRNRATQAWVWLSILIGVSITCELGRPDDDRLVFPGETTSGYLSPTTVLRRELYPGDEGREGPPRGADRREADVPLVPAHIREASARERPPHNLALTAPRPLVAEGNDRRLRALRARRAAARGRADGRGVRRLAGMDVDREVGVHLEPSNRHPGSPQLVGQWPYARAPRVASGGEIESPYDEYMISSRPFHNVRGDRLITAFDRLPLMDGVRD
jgi:hypothetical protein